MLSKLLIISFNKFRGFVLYLNNPKVTYYSQLCLRGSRLYNFGEGSAELLGIHEFLNTINVERHWSASPHVRLTSYLTHRVKD